jgi:hypothetical protein
MGKSKIELMAEEIERFRLFVEENGIVDTTTCWWE